MQFASVTRAEAARKLGITRVQIAGLERDGVAQVSRDDRGVPAYSDAEVRRLGDLLQSGQLTTAAKARSSAPTTHASPSRHIADDVASRATEPGSQLSDSGGRSTAVHDLENASVIADDEVRRLQVAAAVARADLERLQAEALRDEAVRLQSEAARARRVEALVEQTLDSVYPFERPAVEQLLRHRLLGMPDLAESFALRAVIARVTGDARQQLMQQRIDADRVSAERRAASERATLEAQQRAASARAANDAEQHARVQAAWRAQSIASAIAAEAAWQGCPPWLVDLAGLAAWQALVQMDPPAFQDDMIASGIARNAGHQAVAHAATMALPRDQSPDDELSMRRCRGRRRR